VTRCFRVVSGASARVFDHQTDDATWETVAVAIKMGATKKDFDSAVAIREFLTAPARKLAS
jgi:hypothetical protein